MTVETGAVFMVISDILEEEYERKGNINFKTEKGLVLTGVLVLNKYNSGKGKKRFKLGPEKSEK